MPMKRLHFTSNRLYGQFMVGGYVSITDFYAIGHIYLGWWGGGVTWRKE